MFSVLHRRPGQAAGQQHHIFKSSKMPGLHRTALRRRTEVVHALRSGQSALFCTTSQWREQKSRLADAVDNHIIHDRFATLRNKYETPKNPIILAHGLLGFEELHLAGQNLPGIKYWYGITDALAAKGVEVITATVPPSGSIEKRAQKLAESIERRAGGKAVNIIAYVPAQSDQTRVVH